MNKKLSGFRFRQFQNKNKNPEGQRIVSVVKTCNKHRGCNKSTPPSRHKTVSRSSHSHSHGSGSGSSSGSSSKSSSRSGSKSSSRSRRHELGSGHGSGRGGKNNNNGYGSGNGNGYGNRSKNTINLHFTKENLWPRNDQSDHQKTHNYLTFHWNDSVVLGQLLINKYNYWAKIERDIYTFHESIMCILDSGEPNIFVGMDFKWTHFSNEINNYFNFFSIIVQIPSNLYGPGKFNCF